MQANTIVEHSILLGYAIAYCGENDTYIVYSQTPNSTVNALIDTITDNTDNAPILLVTDEGRAKGMCNAPDWGKIIDRINGHYIP
jgi:hypothetical protein